MNPIVEEARRTPVAGEFEVVVLGGGPAGIAAAIAAGRAGRATALIERYGFLGGAGTAAGLANFCGLHANVYGEHRQVVHGICDDILQRLRRMNGLSQPHLAVGRRIQAQAYDISAYKIAADELLLEAKVKLFFHALAVGATADHLLIETKSGRRALAGKIFIDCSGDGDLAAWRGAPFEVGDGRGGMLFPSTMYRICGVDPQKAGNAWERIPQLMEQAEQAGRRFPRKKPIVRPQPNPIEWRANLTQIRNPDGSPVSGIDAEQLSYGEVEGRRQCRDTFEFIKSVTPGFEKAYIVEIAPQIGIRETRRVRGEYMVSEDDIVDCVDFPDAVGVNGWPVEAHVAGNVDFRFARGERGFNQLPYRMIVPQNIDNLLVAGRCASMTHDGQSSARVSGPCFVMGQAAGTAAHLSLKSGKPPRQVDVQALQERLAHDGAYLGSDLVTQGR
ncbi:MAG TPA: FAD-dependent oxidoreductase [Burkholderiales bacterium]